MTPEQAHDLAQLFSGQLEHESEITRRVLAAVPEHQLEFKLGEKGRTARELMWHLVHSEVWFGKALAAGEFPMEAEPPAPATAQEITAWYTERIGPAIAEVKDLTGPQLAKPINFFKVFNFPAVMYLQFWASHSIHHRGQLSTYLRAMNARVPDIYGGSADEPFQMPATAP
jgi:uncharacterized damage-inducible protein DinB